MWQTSCGESVLTGAEADLLQELIGFMVDNIVTANELGESHETGVMLFDKLQPTQQMAMLYLVANALLRDDVPEPELSAINEAAVYAVYCELAVLIDLEIDALRFAVDPDFDNPEEDSHRIRALTLAAYESSMSADEIYELMEDDFIPDSQCADPSSWEPIIEGLADRILWDRDFEMEYLMADEDPARSELIKSFAGIDEGYYTAIAADTSELQFTQLRDQIRKLVRDR